MVCCNLTVAVIVLWLARYVSGTKNARTSEPDVNTAPARETPATRPVTSLSLPLAVLLAFASGFAAIGIEVLWTRALAMTFPATVYVFALVLAAYLAGIGIGSLLLPLLLRRAPGARLLVAVYAVCALGGWSTLLTFPHVAETFFALIESGGIGSWSRYIGGVGIATWAAMLPATLAMGAALPLLIGLAVGQREETCGGEGNHSFGRVAGALYALNVAGGVSGSLATTFWVMPALGLSASVALFAFCYIVLAGGALLAGGGLGGFRSSSGAVANRRRRALGPGALALIGVVGIGTAVGGIGVPEIDYSGSAPLGQLLFRRADPDATVAVYEYPAVEFGGGRAAVRTLTVNNYYWLNITRPRTVEMQYRLGHLPLLIHPRPRSALLIGFATGNTLAAMAEHPLARLDCVEIVGRLFELAKYFTQVNRRVWKDPKVHLHDGDGRRYLLRDGPRYDVIVGDLYLPRNPGVGALYSSEHFRAVRQRLARGGVFVSWLPLWQLTPREVGIIIRTMREVFPEAEGWLGNDNPERPVLGLVGYRDTLEAPAPVKLRGDPALDKLRADLQRRMHASLVRSYGPDMTALRVGRLRVLSAEMLERWGAGAPVNTLEHPVIEYSAPRSMTQFQLRRVTPAAANLARIAGLAGDRFKGK
jgi:spermidine synthase